MRAPCCLPDIKHRTKMHSYLIVSANENDRNSEALRLAAELLGVEEKSMTNSPDLFVISNEEKSSIGIEKVREIIGWLSVKPFQSKAKVVVIQKAELLTNEAQNAILKTLEEPPGNSKIILACGHKSRLLPTIISRCAVLGVPLGIPETKNEKGEVESTKKFLEILGSGIGKRLDFTEENKEILSKKETSLKTLDAWLAALKSELPELINNKPAQARKRLKLAQITKASVGILNVKKEISTTNVSPRNLIELLLINL